MSTTIYCKLQNRLGAIDRVIAAFTHRGLLPSHMSMTQDEADRSMEMAISFECDDVKVIEKLVKFLQKQVYVLEAGMFFHETQSSPQEATAPVSIPKARPRLLPSSDVQFVERKISHAHNA
jgi:acetolactate synthase regulatory subunit